MIKALFFDIDGTLVSFNTHQIPESTINALEAAKAKGLKIFISTGRPIPIINNLSAIEHLIDGYITTNGAYCIVGDKVIFCNPIPKEDVEMLIKLSDEHNFPCIFVGEKDIVIHNNSDIVKQIFSDFLHVHNLKTGDPHELMSRQEIIQTTPFITEDEEKNIMPMLPGCISGRWYPAFADVTAIGSDKGNGIKHIANHFGFGIDETMAFGDGGNDISMIKAAGIGVAMENANDSLKEVADYITTSVDDNGIELALKHWKVID